MRVIIVGASKVGYAFVKQVSKENVDIVVIDKDEAAIEKITDDFDCNGYVGNGSSEAMLRKVGIESASLLVALTKSDETNLLCCSIAKKMGIKRTIAAVRGQEYKEDKDFFIKEMGVDTLINPDKTAARSVNRLIRYAGDVELTQFGDSEVSVGTVAINESSLLANVEMPKVREILGVPILICAIDRKGKMIAPKGKHQIKPGDIITFLAIGKDFDSILSKLGIIDCNVKKTVIVGGGKVGRYLAKLLLEQGGKVTLIDRDEKQCEKLLEELPGAHIICGDGTDSELMEQELHKADACVAMTGRDEENLIISMFARSLGMERIAAEIDNDNYSSMLKRSGVNHTFSTRDAAIGTIVRDLRLLVAQEDENDNSVIKWFSTLDKGRIETVEFELTPEFGLIGIPFKDSRFAIKSGVLIAVIIRDGQTILPNGDSTLQVGDRVIIVSCEHKITKLTEIMA